MNSPHPIRASLLASCAALCLAVSTQNALGAVSDAAGNYGGIIEDTNSAFFSASGSATIVLSKSGAVSGALIWQGERYSFKGTFPSAGPLEISVPKRTAEGITLQLALTLDDANKLIAGTLQELAQGSPGTPLPFELSGASPDPTLSPHLEGLRVAFIDPPNAAAPTIAAEEELVEAAADVPGDGFSLIRVAKVASRAGRFVGRLPDFDGAYSAGSPLRGQKYAIFSRLYRQKKSSRAKPKFGGQLSGLATVSANEAEPPSVTSSFRWGKKPNNAALAYQDGFQFSLFVPGVVYPKLRAGELLPIGPEGVRQFNSTIRFRRGNLGEANDPLQAALKFTFFSTKVVGANPHKVRLRVNPLAATFGGSFIHPDTGEKMKFSGAFQSRFGVIPGEGRGSFRGSVSKDTDKVESGSVRITVNL
jgi:hypothetical protein